VVEERRAGRSRDSGAADQRKGPLASRIKPPPTKSIEIPQPTFTTALRNTHEIQEKENKFTQDTYMFDLQHYSYKIH
jgi:hypothetical protein